MSPYHSRDVPLRAGAMADIDPITSIIIVHGQPVEPTAPETYTVVNVNLNSNAGGAYIYLAYSRSSIHGDPITGLQVFAEYQSNTFPGQPGFIRVNNDLSEGAGGKYVFAFYKKNQANHPIYHVDVLAGSSSRTYPSDDTWVRINQDTNERAGGSYVYICYKETP